MNDCWWPKADPGWGKKHHFHYPSLTPYYDLISFPILRWVASEIGKCRPVICNEVWRNDVVSMLIQLARNSNQT